MICQPTIQIINLVCSLTYYSNKKYEKNIFKQKII